jgi:hypothetical protein
MFRFCAAAFVFASASVLPGSVWAEPFVATLTLDSVSHVSFDDRVVVPIPGGGSIRMVGYPHEDGRSAGLRVTETDISARSMTLPDGGGTVRVELLRPGTGHLRSQSDGSVAIELEFEVRLSLTNDRGTSVHEMPLRFTTDSVEAWNADGSKRYEVSGLEAKTGSRQVQLVAEATAPATAEAGSGAAVYAVLSGQFDALPSLQAP